MTALADRTAPVAPSRRLRAAAVASRALAGGVLAAAVAAAAWLVAGLVAGTAFVVLLIATVVVALLTARGRNTRRALWLALGIGWAVVAIEHWGVQSHAGVWVGIAAWVGVVAGARRAGISRWALPLLAYPALSIAIALAAGQSLLSPWGVSWLWVAAALGPVLGVRVLLDPTPRG
jgi:hypothetical protein